MHVHGCHGRTARERSLSREQPVPPGQAAEDSLRVRGRGNRLCGEILEFMRGFPALVECGDIKPYQRRY